MAKNINDFPFDESTHLKLNIFRECFREWFPVFLNIPWVEEVVIFDFFAGSGKDSLGNPGSPIILLDEAKGQNRAFCGKNSKKVSFSFNELDKAKKEQLDENVKSQITKCEQHNTCGGCVYDFEISESEFKRLFKNANTKAILESKKIGKFVLLDQYGFKEIDDEIFQKLIAYPLTDFIFFISSSFIRRFQEHPSVKAYINTEKINFDNSKPKECHRIIAQYFRDKIPSSKEYYLHHFSIQKELGKGNYYGLIFGSNHTLGMEKFLKICWQKDRLSGEANFNINDDFELGTLFYDDNSSNKKEKVSNELREQILKGGITNNIDGFKYLLRNGCEPILFISVVKELEKQNKIRFSDGYNNSSTNIHRAKKYDIILI